MEKQLSLERVYTAFAVVLLSVYPLIRRLSEGKLFSFADHLAVVTALQHTCSPVNFDQGAWTPPVTCLSVLLGEIFSLPIVYFFVLLLIKLLLFFSLFFLYKNIQLPNNDQVNKNIFALYTLLFIVILGGGRFLIGGTDLLLHSSIATRQWALLTTLISLILFVDKKYFLSSLLLSLSLFLHPANTFHLSVILLISTLIVANPNTRLRSLILFGIPIVLAIATQYVAAYGLPEIGELNISHDSSVQQGSTMAEDSYKETRSTIDWYNYVYSQDPDDLSLIWVITHGYGKLYLVFLVFGFYFSWRVLKTQTNALHPLIRNPFVAISITTVIYLLVCSLIEFTMYPLLLVDQLIVVQPRRALYIPVILLSYFVLHYSLEYFFDRTKINFRRFLTLLIFWSWFLLSLVANSRSNDISPIFLLVAYFILVSVICVHYYFHRAHIRLLNPLMRTKPFAIIGILVVLLKMLPLSTNADVFRNIESYFFDLNKRGLRENMQISATLKSDQTTLDYLEITRWITLNTDKNDRFASAGLKELMSIDFPFLTEYRDRLSLNPYYARGGMHYSKDIYKENLSYYLQTLGVSDDQLTSTTAGSIDGLKSILTSFTSDRLMALADQYGIEFDYLLTTYKLPLPIVKSVGSFSVYDLRQN